MNQGQSRIGCPRCRANNFPGKMHCWQCGGSLPPPEAVGQPAPAPVHYAQQPLPDTQYPTPNAYPPAGYAQYPPLRPSRRWFLAPLAFLLVAAILGGLFFFAFRSRARQTLGPLEQAPKTFGDYANRLRREGGLGDTGANDSETDPTISQARREIERLSGQAGAYAPPVSQDGKVHLQRGGSISPEEYERARRSLGSP